MRRVFLLVLSAAIGVATLVADPTLVFRDDPIYEQVRRIALHAGTNPPPQVSPITRAELMLVLQRIDPEELSARVRQDYMDAVERLADSSPGVPYGTVGLGATAEFYAHTADEPDEWIHAYPDRR
ncbi:MAG TPA: hypothetical protein VKA06_06270, partial [Spirochaetia bacterium]|nr:hypothetical protein [Spirochaetia bacterium]